MLARSERIVNVFWTVMASSNGGGAVGCYALHKLDDVMQSYISSGCGYAYCYGR